MKYNPLTVAVKTAMFTGAAMMVAVPATYAADDTVEEIVVTGSRIQRPDLDAVSPFSVVSGEEFKISGNLNIEQKLAELPNTLPSFGPSSNNPGDGTARVDLRGLGSSRTLVLVNGRRYIPATQTGIVDLNSIPGTLIKQVDVLTGGASAVYGSDAIAGVVNFQLIDDFEGAEITGLYDITTEADAEKWNTDITIGGNFADGRGNAVAYASISDRKALFQGDRSFSDVALTEGDALIDVDTTGDGVFDSTDGFVDSLVAGGSSGIPSTRLFGGNFADPDDNPATDNAFRLGTFNTDGTAAPFTQRFNYAPDNFLQLPQERLLLSSMAHFDITDNARIYSELTFSRNKVPQELAPTPAFLSTLEINPNSVFFGDDVRRALVNFDDFNEDGITNDADVDDREQAGLDANDENDANPDPDYVPYVLGESQTERDVALSGADIINDDGDLGPAGVDVDGDGAFDVAAADSNGDGIVDLTDDSARFLGTVGRRMVENGSRQVIDTRNGVRLLVGVKGDINDAWAYDAYYSKSHLDQTNLLNNDVSDSRFRQAILVTDDGTACQDTSGGCVPLNIFGEGNISQEAVDFINIGASNVTNIEEEVIQGTLSGDTGFALPSTDRSVAVVVGYEHRSNFSSFRPDEFLSAGDVLGFNAGLPTVGRVNVGEIFTEVSVPLVGDSLDFWFAARNSNYSTAVSSVNSFATALNWTINDYAKARVGFQQAVRAPNVSELFLGLSNGFPGAADPCSDEISKDTDNPTNEAKCIADGVAAADVGVFEQANTQVEAILGGNTTLKEEESDTFTVGVVLQPLDNLDITIDYYDIEITDFIDDIGAQNILNLCYNDSNVDPLLSAFACDQITRRADGNVNEVINLNENRGGIHTTGIDLNVNFSTDLGFGVNNASDLSIEFKSTFLDSFEDTPFNNATPLECAGAYGNICGSPLTETLWNARTTWSTGDWTISGLLRFIGETTDDRIAVDGQPLTTTLDPDGIPDSGDEVTGPAFVVTEIDAEYYLDLSAKYDFSENFAVTFGINNILDTEPTKLGDSQEQANTFPSTYELFGPRAFVSASYKFF